MLLSHRPAKAEDFIQAYDLLAPWYGMSKEDLSLAWQGMLAREGVWSLVIEDVENGARPLSLSMSVFVSDRMAERIETAVCAPIGGVIASRFLTRGDEPLTLDRIRSAHFGDGLNLVSLHTVGLDVPLGDSSTGALGEPPVENVL